MKRLRRYTGLGLVVSGLLPAFGLFLTGCGMFDDGAQSSGTAAFAGDAKNQPSEVLRNGDKVIVSLSLPGTTSSDNTFAMPHEENIRQDGTITLQTIGPVQAAGKTPGDLQKDIFNFYVPRYYTSNLNVTVTAPDRVYYVGGEVKQPNRYIYTVATTVTQAIKSAGDFTDFANKRNVRLIRVDGSTYVVNCIKALEDPSYDLPVFPGDTITVKRHW